MNKGTKEELEEEKNFVINFNRGSFSELRKNFDVQQSIYAVRVVEKHYSELSNSKVLPKSDAYLVEGDLNSEFLDKHNYLLNEKIIKDLKLKTLINSGISIKRIDSKKYQIHKFTVSSFLKFINIPALAAGCSIYIKGEKMKLNKKILEIWRCKEEEFLRYHKYESKKFEELKEYEFSEIKRFSNEQIKLEIKNDDNKLNYIFSGKGYFEEPFCASWLYESGKISELQPYDFVVTTGSGRLKSPTIVIKPK